MYFYGVRKTNIRIMLFQDEKCSRLAGYMYVDENTEPISIKIATFDNPLIVEGLNDECEDFTSYGGEIIDDIPY